jgi:hypothetical protein
LGLLLVTGAGVYVRVSSPKGQKTDSQRAELEVWLKRNRLKAVEWFEDRDSATNLQRKSFQELQAAIFAGKTDTVVVWKLDRLAPIGSFPTSSGLNMRPNLPIGTLRGICVNGLVETTHSDFGPARRAGETKIAMAHALLASTSVIEQLLNSFQNPSCRAKYGKCGKTLRSVARPLGRQGIAHYRGRAARANCWNCRLVRTTIQEEQR